MEIIRSVAFLALLALFALTGAAAKKPAPKPVMKPKGGKKC